MKTENIDVKDIKKLMEDVALIKQVLSISKKDPDGELTEWARKELVNARAEREENYISLNDI